MPARIDLGQIAKVERAAAQQFGRVGAEERRGREEARRDVLPFPLEQRTKIGRQLGPLGRRPDGKIGLGHGLQQAPAGGVVAGIPGDPRGLAGGVGQAVEG